MATSPDHNPVQIAHSRASTIPPASVIFATDLTSALTLVLQKFDVTTSFVAIVGLGSSNALQVHKRSTDQGRHVIYSCLIGAGGCDP